MSDRDMFLTQSVVRLQSVTGAANTVLTAVLSKTAITGTVTTGTSTTVFIDTGLSSTNSYLGRWVRFTSGALVGDGPRYITTYVPATQSITVTKAFSGTPQVGDTFEILPILPSWTKKVALLGWNVDVAAPTAATINVTLAFVQTGTGVRYASSLGGSNAGAPGPQNHEFPYPAMVTQNIDDGTITLTATPGANWVAAHEIFVRIAATS